MSNINYKKLEEILKDKKEIAILMHVDPDPDAIGSALGVQLLLEEHFKIQSEIFYPGEINRPENKSLAKKLSKLEVGLIDIDDSSDQEKKSKKSKLEKYENDVILVDTAESDLVKNPLIVIDHHKLEKSKIKAQFKYINKVGACVTLVYNLLEHYQIKLDKEKHESIITAMHHGLRSDTNKVTLNMTDEDKHVDSSLHNLVTYKELREVEDPSQTAVTMDVQTAAYLNKEIKGSYAISYVGLVKASDAIPPAADYLLKLSGIETSIVFGIFDDGIDEYIKGSIRTKDGSQDDPDKLAKDIFGPKAGGKDNAAGCYVRLGLKKYEKENEQPTLVSLGILDLVGVREKRYELVKEAILEKIYEAIKTDKNEKRNNQSAAFSGL